LGKDNDDLLLSICTFNSSHIRPNSLQILSNFPRRLLRILIMLCFLLRQQVHESQVSGDSPIARPSRCLLCSHSFLYINYNSISSLAPNCHLAGLCHFLRGGYSGHSLLTRIFSWLVMGKMPLGFPLIRVFFSSFNLWIRVAV
jgi:hypothetical protein